MTSNVLGGDRTTGPSATLDLRPSIAVKGLSKTFGEHIAVDGIDLSIGNGELFALLGPNGAGKTTTIRMLACLLRPTDGTATIMGHDVRSDPFAVKGVIALSPQETAIAEHLNAWENLSLLAGAHRLGKSETRARSAELLDMVGLTERAGERAKKYSGGMKRRLSIAMALVCQPRVLFLDEPTIGLDPQARRSMWEHIANLKGEMTVVLTTHYLEEADALADRIAVIDRGKVIALGTPQELKDKTLGTTGMFVQAQNVSDEAMAALRVVYPQAVRADGGILIDSAEVSVYAVGDCLRPFGVEIESTERRRATLDDVFLELTGKEMRE